MSSAVLLVVDIPEGEEQGGCAGAKEAALEAEELVAGGDKVHAGGAAAERDVARGETHLVEIVEVKVAIAEANAGEHGVVLAVGAVGGDVEEGALRAFAFEDFGGGLVAETKVLSVGRIAATDCTSSRIWGARSSGMPMTKEVDMSLGAFSWQRAKTVALGA